MKCLLFRCVFLLAVLQRSNLQFTEPATVRTWCEGDILLLLDSSGSVTNHEFSRLVQFAAELVSPFSLGRGHVRVGLLQVSSKPNLDFGLDVHHDQQSLQEALLRVSQMQGDTNTETALRIAQKVLTETQKNVPKVLLWLTDGVDPGDVDKPMSELKARGVSVLIVSTIHANYQVLQRAVSPPIESHLFFVDFDDINIIKEDMLKAIIKIICTEQLRVVDVTSHSAVLKWHPILKTDSGYYELWYQSVLQRDPEIRRTLSFESISEELTSLQPETTYMVSLRPESNLMLFNTLTVYFTTLPVLDFMSPAFVSVSDSGPSHIRVSWGPLQPAYVQRYTVEYGAIPSGRVQTVVLHGQQNSVVLTGLEPDTQYLVTISALHVNGKDRAMSVRACTQEAPPGLVHLQLTPVAQQEVEVKWLASQEGLKGYWLSWEGEKSHTSSVSSIYLPPTHHSIWLPHIIPSSRVCVSPIYSSGRGDGLCCTAQHKTG
ncbi:von Willebrand factor A domain-containing protein 1 isoform X2 [Anabas testudineus]|uniref:von Willebrand factor A domain-containing protein 1 isoform X2 n=1 Tax=Anabas testudineus TaxID=64144 RepID=UPI000E45FDA5|nr:von Willebrand factor A domain-containing protein 1 isoform X2 [Anabas testudineus]